MNKESLEHLSSLMDGEINKDTGRFIIRRLESDEEMRATWTRYHMVRDCMRHQEGNLSGSDFSRRVQQALEDDNAEIARPAFASRWLKPVAGVAIAASVALMAIVTVGPGPGAVDGPPTNALVDAPLESFVSPNSALSGSPVSQQASTAGRTSDRQKMNTYLLRHYQVTGSTGGKGFVTLVPIVSTRAMPQQPMTVESELNAENLSSSSETTRQ